MCAFLAKALLDEVMSKPSVADLEKARLRSVAAVLFFHSRGRRLRAI